MKRQHLPLYAVALAILIVGLAFAGMPVQTILLGLAVLACPLMMLMMGRHGGHGGNMGSDQDTEHQGKHPNGPAGRR